MHSLLRHPLFFGLIMLLSLTACKSQEMELYGKVSILQHEGQTCWIFTDENNNAYEIITASSQILQPGMTAAIRAVEVNRKTSCQLPTVIDIVSYRPVNTQKENTDLIPPSK